MKQLDFTKDWFFYKEGNNEKEKIDLPHDAMLYEKRAAGNPSTGACACFEGGKYYYEKFLDVPSEWEGENVELYFEGVYQKAEVFLNDKKVGGCAYGYSAFRVSLEGLKYGTQNRIKVVADNSKIPNSRWYTGSGIYRPVWLLTGGEKRILYHGIKIKTLSYDPAKIQVDIETTGGQVETKILFGKEEVASGKGNSLILEIPDAKLWSDETPNLYQCKVTLREGDAIIEEAEETFGIRKIEYSNKGLFINGKETKLRGGCVHHDNGILGAKTYAESEWRRVRKLKEAGYNAIRSSHNPCATEMLKACDYYGVYMMDESWDTWFYHKNKEDYGSEFMSNYEVDLRSMVEKDYNHPCVIMYSIGNEIAEPATQKGLHQEKIMIDLLHELDPDRIVTCGLNLMILTRAAGGKAIYNEEGGRDTSNEKTMNSSLMFNMIVSVVGSGMNKGANSKKADKIITPAVDMLDIAGYNYASGRYPLEGKEHPNRIIFGSETFPQDLPKNWAMVKKYPYLLGDFMWTSWDYIGEAGAGAWGYTKDSIGFEKPYPWLLADMGVIDILGNPNGELFWARAVWNQQKGPEMAVRPANHPGRRPTKSTWRGTNAIPSWSWSGCEGNKTIVEVYYPADSVKLYLNNKCIGSKKVKEFRAMFKVKYMPGILTAVAYDAFGTELGRTELCSAKKELTITMKVEEEKIKAGSLVHIPICITDEDGIVESNADEVLQVSVSGGKLLGFGSADPRTEDSFVTGKYKTYYGQALAIVRTGEKEKMSVCVTYKDKQMEKEWQVEV